MGRVAVVKRTVALVAATLLGWSLVGCGGPSQAGCRAALQEEWSQALGNPVSDAPGSRPAACDGLPDDVVSRLVAEVMSSPVAV